MVVERNSATGDRVERRQSIIAPCEQPVASLVTDHKDDVVERPIAGRTDFPFDRLALA